MTNLDFSENFFIALAPGPIIRGQNDENEKASRKCFFFFTEKVVCWSIKQKTFSRLTFLKYIYLIITPAPGVNFANILLKAFMRTDLKSVKRY